MIILWNEDILTDYRICILLRKAAKQSHPFSNASVLTRDTWLSWRTLGSRWQFRRQGGRKKKKKQRRVRNVCEAKAEVVLQCSSVRSSGLSKVLSVLPWQPANLPVVPSLHWSPSAQRDLVHPGKKVYSKIQLFQQVFILWLYVGIYLIDTRTWCDLTHQWSRSSPEAKRPWRSLHSQLKQEEEVVGRI